MVEHLRLASDRDSLDASEPEDDGLCDSCGHAWDMHRTVGHRCTGQVPNPSSDCDLCGGKLQLGWLATDWNRCLNCGANQAPFLRCDCVLLPRIVWNG